MVGFYLKRDISYSVKAYIFKQKQSDDGSTYYVENSPSNSCLCKDNGFTTTYTSVDGHIVKSKTGQLETLDLMEDDILPNDIIEYAGCRYVVVSVKFTDNDDAKKMFKNAYGITQIEVRK